MVIHSATAPTDSPGTPGAHRKLQRRLTDGAEFLLLPDCKNWGTILRVFLPLNMGTVLLGWTFPGGGSLLSALLQVNLVAVLILLVFYHVRKVLSGRAASVQWVSSVGLAALVEVAVQLAFDGSHADFVWISLIPRGLTTVAVVMLFLQLFLLRRQVLLPSHAEGRMQALQARIRPHFLFNSLNTVLGLMRTNPRKAESILENLADLFRVFMRDTRDLVALEEEVLLCKQYLEIEKVRLEDRLAVRWEIEQMPGDALIPSLLLQPLVENAVHHGIEPCAEPGTIRIAISKVGDRVHVEIENPLPCVESTRPGNHMALSNVRERLNLIFDVQGQLKASVIEEQFRVLVHFPYRKERRRRDDRNPLHFDRR